ncbi:MAG: hypothetical protein ABR915_18470 [Thermoguttaceae bacterium]
MNDPEGAVRDPCVSYDGRKILFSYRKADSGYFNLYEINADGSGLRQVTDGPWDDIEPIYLPNDDIVFCSSRAKRWVNCWYTKVAHLYRCGPDGKNMFPLSANIEYDVTPWMMPDGRVLYTRWEYVDRSQRAFHHLWTFNPDGTDVQVFFGNMHGDTAMLDAKPIPGSRKIVSIFSPGHGEIEHSGVLTIVDPGAGPDERASARSVLQDKFLRDPWAFSEDCFLAARHQEILLVNGQGQTAALYSLPPQDPKAKGGMYMVNEPRPLAPRPREPSIPSRINLQESTGRLVLADITHGRNMSGVKPGEVRKLLVLEVLPKPINYSESMAPVTLGGSFSLNRILGTVPVEADGSAYMELPALRSLFFVALGENELSVKRMQSFLSVMPGETSSCAGCHERRSETPRIRPGLQALQRPPSRIEPISGVPEIFDFPRDIQPILDKHCVSCHGPDRYENKMLLDGGRGRVFTHAYFTLMSRRLSTHGQENCGRNWAYSDCCWLVSHGHNGVGNRAPRTIGTSASALLRFLGPDHHKVNMTAQEQQMVRLWIESSACYIGTYAAMRYHQYNAADLHFPLDFPDPFKRRCDGCHTGGRSLPPADLAFDLTHPEKSLMLLAPLARSAGGLNLCKGKVAPLGPVKQPVQPTLTKPEEPPTQELVNVFASKEDPDYQAMLVYFERRIKGHGIRFPMPEWQPDDGYIREMKRYGILPAYLDPAKTRVDPYLTDRAYWQSLWWPQANGANSAMFKVEAVLKDAKNSDGAAIDGLLALAADADPSVRCEATLALAPRLVADRLAGRKSKVLAALAGLSRDADAEVLAVAAPALSTFGAEALDIVAANVKNPSAAIRQGAIRTLGLLKDVKDPRVNQTLSAELGNREPDMMLAVLDAAKARGADAAELAAQVAPFVDSSNAIVSRKAIEALLSIGQLPPTRPKRLEAILVEMLGVSNQQMAMRAVAMVRALGDDEAMRIFAAVLKGNDALSGARACHGLTAIGKPAVPLLPLIREAQTKWKHRVFTDASTKAIATLEKAR